MRLVDCVLALALADHMGTDLKQCARRVLKAADSSAKPYVRLFLMSNDPAAVVRVTLRELET